MLKQKEIRTRGKRNLSQYFRTFNEGDKVSLVRNLSYPAQFPRRIQGTTGVVSGKRGRAYVIKLKDGNKEKTFIIHPIHLKKLK